MNDQNKISRDGKINIDSDTIDIGNDIVGRDKITQTTNVTNYGLTYSEVKSLIQNVFNENFYKLSGLAQELATQRANDFVDLFLRTLNQKYTSQLISATDPDIQYTLFQAQAGFARRGDTDLLDLLVNILVERVGSQQPFEKLVLDEAVLAATKLTSHQYNWLSMMYLFEYESELFKSTDLIAYIEFLETLLLSLMVDKPLSDIQCKYLEITGCITNSYSAQFRTSSDDSSIYPDESLISSLLISPISKAFDRNNKNGLSGKEVNFLIERRVANKDNFIRNEAGAYTIIYQSLDHPKKASLDNITNAYSFPFSYSIKKLSPVIGDFLDRLPENTFYSVTPSGIAVASANIRRIFGEKIRLKKHFS